MVEIFIASKSPELPNHLSILLKEILKEEKLTFLDTYRPGVALTIIDTETLYPSAIEDYTDSANVLFCYEMSPHLLQYTRYFNVSGVFSLSMTATEIGETFYAAIGKNTHYTDEMVAMLFSNTTNEIADSVRELTPREREVVKWMIADKSNEEIALKLGLSIRTVNTHKRNIMKKGGTKTTSGLIKRLMDYDAIVRSDT